LGAAVGDLVLAQLETITGQQNVGEFVVAAITFDPGLLSTVSAYANLDVVNELLDLPPDGHMRLSIMLEDVRSMERFADKFSRILEENGRSLFPRQTPSLSLGLFDTAPRTETWEGIRYQVSTLGDYLSQLNQTIGILNLLGWGILIVLLVIIMTGITNTYRMIMFERTREIGTMRALGMQRYGVKRLFLFEAALLGIFGALVGMAAGFGIMGIAHLYQFRLDSPLFLFLSAGRMRFSVPLWQLMLNSGAVVLLCIAGALAPASRAAALEPGSALRKTY
jgi:putative ABC transport system permease protein